MIFQRKIRFRTKQRLLSLLILLTALLLAQILLGLKWWEIWKLKQTNVVRFQVAQQAEVGPNQIYRVVTIIHNMMLWLIILREGLEINQGLTLDILHQLILLTHTT
jgi:hypothetical protein